jgi:predicted nucleic acid-binding protein
MICVDASLALKWVFVEEHSDKALALVLASGQAGERLVAPPLLPIEVTNAIRQRMRRESLPLQEALDILERFLQFDVTLLSPTGLYREALVLADTYELPAAYDAHYLALAQMLGCELWTNDRRMLNLLQGKLGFVKWIGDYQDNGSQ